MQGSDSSQRGIPRGKKKKKAPRLHRQPDYTKQGHRSEGTNADIGQQLDLHLAKGDVVSAGEDLPRMQEAILDDSVTWTRRYAKWGEFSPRFN